jgi:hypothetical protein
LLIIDYIGKQTFFFLIFLLWFGKQICS